MKIDDIINRQDLNERLDGDFDLFRELAEIFLTDSSRHLNDIETAIKNRDPVALGKSAHTLKGSVSNFSAFRAYDAALELEKIGKSNDLDKSVKAFNVLEKEIEILKDAMKQIFEENKL